ncbi:MAG: indole-3-glycerol phosphate synthase TrpC [Candidatus Omnitrophica bacterium]|jgi:indole-3-glycerol phosphate synthase|nr:indole-3-glycerol phosphate synthase TrpC [Candidatus Omnitrophota bacterium]MDD3274435.1 indole-3-glycerol phosphate synthase TrpC [Candidatus Omnitrophota bacterium]MDD5077544.1 indole-3-glycerol phosphate synthase TrpC [Candidatus Omnitrophota bacterium]
MAKTDVLKQIVAKKKERILAAKQQISQEELVVRIADLSAPRPFKEAISKPKQISLIAEIKQASPSSGLIRQDFNPEGIARIYQEVGVQAISVLTEEDFFNGSPSYLEVVKNVTTVPVLRKDFILESYQVYESRYLGADAVLFIADLLTKDKLVECMQVAEHLGMDYLVEVHDEKELKKVLSLKTVQVVGINNRSLRTLEVDFKTTEKLFTLIPKDKTIVVESGIKNAQDVLFLKILGASAVLVGTVFMASHDIKNKVEEVMGW